MGVSISIVILNYNSSKYTIDCINSILSGSYQNYEIILVDNNSNADERGVIIDYLNVKNNGKIHYRENGFNFGFALGNIFGISEAKGEYIFVLNNDTLVDEHALGILHSFMEDNPDVSLCIPSQYDKDGRYHPSFAYLPSVANQWLGDGLCRMLKPSEYMDRKKEYKTPFSVQMGSGASMFFRASDYFKVGGLDPNFFLYCEEEDICIRMKKEKMNIFFVPDAKIIHYGGGSTNRNIEIEIEFYRSLFYFFDKNYKYISARALKFRFITKELIKSCKNPARFKLLLAIIRKSSLSHSLRHKQRGLKN
ncbi:glycosyltransferase family 2 protein [Aeromonas eucrenophila]|uniref:Glycosyltransferase family 2 protein n=1 Tax=Aeromonas eucrenophila TaxID=649 RepID=A0ABW0YG66_9GAMM|nr:glycosyltransferase family 2 protein [Aeromonas eucrenophila]